MTGQPAHPPPVPVARSLRGPLIYAAVTSAFPLLLISSGDVPRCNPYDCGPALLIGTYLLAAIAGAVALVRYADGRLLRAICLWAVVITGMGVIGWLVGRVVLAARVQPSLIEFTAFLAVMLLPSLLISGPCLLRRSVSVANPPPPPPPPPQPADDRRFRGPGGWTAWPAFILAGPCNPVAFYLGWPDPAYVLQSTWNFTVGAILLPATVMAAIAIRPLSCRRRISQADLAASTAIGLVVGIALAPLGLAMTGFLEGQMVGPSGIFAVAFFGWFFGIIPYFAQTIAVPVSLSVFVIGVLATRPVRTQKGPPVGDPLRNSDAARVSGAGPDA